MSSFSDAHECREIPYITANLHQLMLPRQCQVWAVLSPELELKEIQYRLVSGILGRCCLSGPVQDLNTEQWREVEDAMRFYGKVEKSSRREEAGSCGPAGTISTIWKALRFYSGKWMEKY